MNYLIQLFSFLSGKKTYIFAVCLAIVTFLSSQHLISDNVATLFNSLIAILAGGTAVGTAVVGAYAQKTLGVSLEDASKK